jgi:1,4-alpha-glucan branching enzyme
MKRGLWWQTGVIYQIYPRSFQDSNGDGIGDLRGITQRLPYLVELGVDAVWLSPIFPSPMADFGYDISDYTDIDPVFGNLGDFDALLATAHAQGLKVILDLVPNHTSSPGNLCFSAFQRLGFLSREHHEATSVLLRWHVESLDRWIAGSAWRAASAMNSIALAVKERATADV